MRLPWFFPYSLKVFALLAAALFVNATQADPVLGGITLGYPLTFPTQVGTLTYTAGGGAVGTFVVNVKPLSTNFGDGNGPIFFAASPAPTLTVQFSVDKQNCVADPDKAGVVKICPVAEGSGITNLFQVTGAYSNPAYSMYNGVVLNGVVTQFGFNYTRTGVDSFDMRVTLTGGTMASLYQGKDIGVRIQAENSTFHGRFDENFSVNPAKPTVGAVAPRLGDRVWEDKNGNGQQDCTYTPATFVPMNSAKLPGLNAVCAEPGIPGVTVKLVDCATGADIPGAATVTDANGFYQFTNLQPAVGGTQYCVKFDKSTAPSYCTDHYPNGPGGTLQFTQKHVGDVLTDSNADPTTGLAAPVTLAPGQITLSVDAGLYCPVALGDTLWSDSNQNGIQDNLNRTGGEPGINGQQVFLYDCAGNLISMPSGQNPTTTGPAPANPVSPQVPNGAGWYQFTGLSPGCYTVKFTPPANFFFSLPDQSHNDEALDSDANPASGTTGPVNLASGADNPAIDAGVYRQISALGDRVWQDLNANGIQDANEPGICGVPIKLLDGGCQPFTNPGFVVSTTTSCSSGSEGLYKFDLLPANNYCIQFDNSNLDLCAFGPPGNGASSPRNAPNSTAANDSDADTATGLTGPIALPPNTYDPNWDAGFYCPAKLGDFVWFDCNQNGVQDDAGLCPYGEGYPNVTVSLLDCDGNPVTDLDGNASTATDDIGQYAFRVKPGGYKVKFDLPAGTVFSTLNAPGATAANGSDADQNGLTACITVPSNLDDETWDAGIYTPTEPGVALVKFTNGVDGNNANGTPLPAAADNPPVVGGNTVAQVAAGQSIQWTFRVINTGSEPLSDLVLDDPRAPTDQIVCPDTGNNTITSLAVGASVDCVATATAAALAFGPSHPEVVEGCGSNGNSKFPTYENTASVSGTGAYNTTITVAASDQSHYCNPNPGVTIIKYTNGVDANDPDGMDVPNIVPGAMVTWTYQVTNTGNVSAPKAQVSVTDNQPGVMPSYSSELSGNGDATFDPGEVWFYQATGTALDLTNPPAGVTTQTEVCVHGGTEEPRTAYVNIGTVTIPGASSTDPSSYCNDQLLLPTGICNLSLTKTAGPTQLTIPKAGGNCPNVTYTYTIINQGDPVQVTLSDDKLNLGAKGSFTLAVNETKVITQTTCLTETTVSGSIAHGELVENGAFTCDAVAMTTVEVTTGYGGTAGCTLGYWKQGQHFNQWKVYTQAQNYWTVFGVSRPSASVLPANLTLLQALKLGGGGEKHLARQSVAALLNAAHAQIDYFTGTQGVIALVQQAYASGSAAIANLATRFDTENNKHNNSVCGN